MKKPKYLLLILLFYSITGCAVLFTEQEYVLINENVREEFTFSGIIYSLPMKTRVRKVVLLGEGTIRNFEVAFRNNKNRWIPITHIQKAIEFPFEITFYADTDAVKITQRTIAGQGRINTVEFYTIAENR